ncbi:MAG TPA: DNA polymerase [Candidatus Paceibacterota bacterium]|nr:DNA polymerase [Candidatus Paceibacterota bacterium]
MPKTKEITRKKRLIVLDSHAIIHRAYHALPEFTGPDGQPTGALFGLASMLLRIMQDLRPDYVVAAYDLPKPTVRHEAYEHYKGTRAQLEDALVAQLTTARRVLEAFCIPVYEKEGFEADDVIGTIVAKLADQPNIEVVIASGDMDALQLVEKGRVKVYTLKKGLNDTIMYDEKAVEARYGFPPELVPDYKGLRGDPSDNIKGVPGIGEKTATELIQKFGSIEAIYKAVKKDEKKLTDKGIKPRIVNLLKEHEEDALFSKMLATIRIDAPIAFKLPKEDWEVTDRLDKILALFDELGFRSLRARARAVIGGNAAPEEEDERGDDAPLAAQDDVDPTRLAEAKVMLWLLASDFTNPSQEDVLAFTKAATFDAAYAELEKQIAATGRLKEVYEEIERPLIPVLQSTTEYGVLIDKKALEKLGKKYRAELETVQARIYEHAGGEFNINSPKQLGEVLFDKLGLVVKGQKKTAGGQRSTRESELEKLRELHPIVDDIMEYREIGKLLSTYIDVMPALADAHDRIHPEFIQTGAVTGRMATTNPSIQNIPIRTERGRAIRDAFIAPKGSTLVGLDYSQIELRLAAILSGDEKLIAIFKSGRDIHREVAAMVLGVDPEKVDHEMRRRAKIINFGILYGMGANALKQQLGSSIAEAHQYLDDYFATFKTLSEYLESTKGFARKHGYTETLFGRRRQFPEMKSPLPYVRAQGERMAINAPMQGTQSDIIKLAMVRIDEYLKKEGAQDDVHLLLQVHDELVYEVTDGHLSVWKKIKEIMETVLMPEQTKGVPILATAKSGLSWGEMVPLD